MLSIYNQALHFAPNDVYAHNNKGLALGHLARLQATVLFQREEAFKSCQTALLEFSRSLEIAPGDEYIRYHREQLQEILDGLGDGS